MAVNHVQVASDGAENVTNLRSIRHGHHPVAIHDSFQRLQGINLGDNHAGTQAARPGSQTASAPTVACHHKDLARQQDIGGAHNAIHRGLPRTIAVIKEMLGHGIIDSNHRE